VGRWGCGWGPPAGGGVMGGRGSSGRRGHRCPCRRLGGDGAAPVRARRIAIGGGSRRSGSSFIEGANSRSSRAVRQAAICCFSVCAAVLPPIADLSSPYHIRTLDLHSHPSPDRAAERSTRRTAWPAGRSSPPRWRCSARKRFRARGRRRRGCRAVLRADGGRSAVGASSDGAPLRVLQRRAVREPGALPDGLREGSIERRRAREAAGRVPPQKRRAPQRRRLRDLPPAAAKGARRGGRPRGRARLPATQQATPARRTGPRAPVRALGARAGPTASRPAGRPASASNARPPPSPASPCAPTLWQHDRRMSLLKEQRLGQVLVDAVNCDKDALIAQRVLRW
jgi:hypothetical protein